MMNEKDYTETVINMRNRTLRMTHEGDYWTQEEHEQLVRLFNEGVGITEIAIRLQRTEPAVAQQIEGLDLYQRKANPKRRKSVPQEPECLCSGCQLCEALCPRCKGCPAAQEAV